MRGKQETKLCGLAAVKARWERDPASFVRLFFNRGTAPRVAALCRALAAARKIYRCVEDAELQRVAGTLHHGGIVAVVDSEAPDEPKAKEFRKWAGAGEAVLVLDRVGNPHNLGALARTAAFLGVRHLIIEASPEASRANDAAYRVSEGGLEALQLWTVSDLPACLRALAYEGYQVFGGATRGGKKLEPGGGARLRRASAPAVLVLGNEEQGMAPAVEAACTELVTLGGSDAVESLNVSVAGALLLWELLARGAPAQRPS